MRNTKAAREDPASGATALWCRFRRIGGRLLSDYRLRACANDLAIRRPHHDERTCPRVERLAAVLLSVTVLLFTTVLQFTTGRLFTAGLLFTTGLLSTAVSAQTAGDTIIVMIDGRPVRLIDLDTRWSEQDPGSFARLQQEQYDGRRRALDSIIAVYLLDDEAACRHVTVEKLLSDELPKRMPSVTDAEIMDAYFRSGAAAQGVSLDQ